MLFIHHIVSCCSPPPRCIPHCRSSSGSPGYSGSSPAAGRLSRSGSPAFGSSPTWGSSALHLPSSSFSAASYSSGPTQQLLRRSLSLGEGARPVPSRLLSSSCGSVDLAQVLEHAVEITTVAPFTTEGTVDAAGVPCAAAAATSPPASGEDGAFDAALASFFADEGVVAVDMGAACCSDICMASLGDICMATGGGSDICMPTGNISNICDSSSNLRMATALNLLRPSPLAYNSSPLKAGGSLPLLSPAYDDESPERLKAGRSLPIMPPAYEESSDSLASLGGPELRPLPPTFEDALGSPDSLGGTVLRRFPPAFEDAFDSTDSCSSLVRQAPAARDAEASLSHMVANAGGSPAAAAAAMARQHLLPASLQVRRCSPLQREAADLAAGGGSRGVGAANPTAADHPAIAAAAAAAAVVPPREGSRGHGPWMRLDSSGDLVSEVEGSDGSSDEGGLQVPGGVGSSKGGAAGRRHRSYGRGEKSRLLARSGGAASAGGFKTLAEEVEAGEEEPGAAASSVDVCLKHRSVGIHAASLILIGNL